MTTLFIDRSNSKCGACHRGADPQELSHETVLSWGGPSLGCGAVFTEVASNYLGMKDRVTQMRPDLPWNGFDGWQ